MAEPTWAYLDPIPPPPICGHRKPKACRKLATRRYTLHDVPYVTGNVEEVRCDDHPLEGVEVRERPSARRRNGGAR